MVHHLINKMDRWWSSRRSVLRRNWHPCSLGARSELARLPCTLQAVRDRTRCNPKQLGNFGSLDIIASAAHQPIRQLARCHRRSSHGSNVSKTGTLPVFDTSNRQIAASKLTLFTVRPDCDRTRNASSVRLACQKYTETVECCHDVSSNLDGCCGAAAWVCHA